jgi:hypothetical protein
MNQPIRTKPCNYCGKKKAGTVDHVPPQAFFNKPRPTDLKTVPCCEECRNKYQLIDDYVILVFGMEQAVSEHPEGSAVHAARLRDLQRPERKRIALELANSMESGELESRSGLYLGAGARFVMDSTKIEEFGKRMAKALYYVEFGALVPNDFDVIAHFKATLLTAQEIQSFALLFKSLRLKLDEFNEIGRAVFKYKIVKFEDTDKACAIVFEFFEHFFYVTCVGPRMKKGDDLATPIVDV